MNRLLIKTHDSFFHICLQPLFPIKIHQYSEQKTLYSIGILWSVHRNGTSISSVGSKKMYLKYSLQSNRRRCP